MARTFPLSNVVELLDAYDRMVGEAAGMAVEAEREITKHSYEMYHRFRARLREAETLAVLVEERLDNVEGGRRPELNERFNEVGARALMMQARSSLRFFYVLSANTFLPLGSREIFLAELGWLEAASEMMKDERFAAFVTDEGANDLDLARDILGEIAGKAPGLFDLARTKSQSE